MAHTTSARRISGLLAALTITAVLAACGSKVRLNEPPVEDRSGTAAGAGAGGAGGQGSGVDQRGVAGVQVPGSNSTQPTQMQRIIYFDYDSFEVKAESTQLLEANARYLNANRNVRVALEGHTDERGGREYNLALGQKRAEAVRRAMALLGVPDSQMEAVSFGEEKPAQTGSDEASWAKNRRVELTYR